MEDDYVNLISVVRTDGSESDVREYTDTLAVKRFGPQCLEHFENLLRTKYMGVDFVRTQRENNAGAESD